VACSDGNQGGIGKAALYPSSAVLPRRRIRARRIEAVPVAGARQPAKKSNGRTGPADTAVAFDDPDAP